MLSLEELKLKFNQTPIVGIELEFYIKSIDLSILNQHFSNPTYIITNEKGQGQFELITVPFGDINALINLITDFKSQLSEFAQQNSLFLSFDAQPFSNEPGSGMHINISFTDTNFLIDNYKFIIGGMLENIYQDLNFFCPAKQDQQRLKLNSLDSPSTISWGYNNRSAAIRLPATINNIEKFRIEHRISSPNADLGQVMNCLFNSVIYGIHNKISPPTPVYGIAHDQQYGLPSIIK